MGPAAGSGTAAPFGGNCPPCSSGTDVVNDLDWLWEATYLSETDEDALMVIRTNLRFAKDLRNVCDITTDALFEIARNHRDSLLAVFGARLASTSHASQRGASA